MIKSVPGWLALGSGPCNWLGLLWCCCCCAEKGGKKGAGEEIDDAGSLCSSSTAAYSMGEAGDTYIDAQAEAFSTAIDDTYESRATTREKAWERIVTLLRNNVRLDDCYQR
jgi:hypothetical protein